MGTTTGGGIKELGRGDDSSVGMNGELLRRRIVVLSLGLRSLTPSCRTGDYADEAAWWVDDQVTLRAESPGGPRSGNRMGDSSSLDVVHYDFGREDALSFAGTKVAADIAAVAATVASKAAISASIMAKAYE